MKTRSFTRSSAELVIALSLALLSVAPRAWGQEASVPDSPRDPEPVPGLEAYVREAMESWDAPGLSLVIVRDDTVYARGFGLSEVGGNRPVTPETLFGIGSLTKAFTATLIAMLVDEGKLAWDDPVVRHLPDFAMRDPYVTRHLTIRDILSHRTGLARSDLLWVPGGVDPDEVVRRLRFQEPAFGFRARYGYNNVMYLVASRVAEEVTGSSWSELLRDRIFTPLGMERSTTGRDELHRRSNVASPHDRIGPGQLLGTVPSRGVPLDAPNEIRRIEWMRLVTTPAGGIGSSAVEFGQWLRFQLGRGQIGGTRLVGEDALLETRTPQMVVPGFPRDQAQRAETHLGVYGMGWGLRDYRGHLLVTHLGSMVGSSGAVALVPSENVAVAVFVNYSQGQWLANAVMRWTLDGLLDSERKDWNEAALAWAEQRRQANTAVLESAASDRSLGTRPSLPLGAYEGTYADSLYPSTRVTLREGTLRLAIGPNLSGRLDHWEDDSFRVTWDRAEFGANLVTFEIADRSRPDALRIRILGQEAAWRRRAEPPGDASARPQGRSDPPPVPRGGDHPR